MKIFKVLATAVFAFSLISTSKAVELPQDIALAKDQSLAYRISSTPESLDPGINVDWRSQNIMKSLYDTLVRQDYRGLMICTGCESWEESEDGLRWTFKLRKDATWTDGKAVVAQDYIYAWQRVLDPKTASLGADYLTSTNIKNARAIKDGELPPESLGVKAVDDFTLEIDLERPTPWLLDTLTFLNTAPVRKDIIEKYGTSWTRAENIVTNGPYRIKEYRFNELLAFEKRVDYWDAKNIYITNINYEVFKDYNSAYYQYLEGRFYTTGIPSQFKDLVRKERPDEVVDEPYPSTYALIINTRLEKFKDRRVRQAINYLIDRDLTVNKIYKAYYPTSTVAPTILRDGEEQLQDDFVLNPKFKAQREAKAIALLTEAGYSKEHPLEIEWLYNKRVEADRYNVGLAYQLRDFSGGLIQPKLKVLDWNSYIETIQRGNFDVVYYILNADYYHVSSFFNIFNPGNANNFSGWTNPEFSALYEQAQNTPDVAKRKALYQEMNKILQEEVPVVPILLSGRVILKSPVLGGFNSTLPFTYMRDYFIIDACSSPFTSPEELGCRKDEKGNWYYIPANRKLSKQ